jgi:tRNA1(Val) A37 N6-methylase TrmN6
VLRSVSPDLAAAIQREATARGGLTPELPGEVYERTRAADRAGRRADAIYYTPPHLVDFTVDRALGPTLAATADVLALRVLDPACGGGAFLLAALARLDAALPGRRAELVRRCLRGIDVDPQAAAVARLALSLAVPDASADDLARAVTVADALRPDAAPPAAFDVVITNPPWGQKRFHLSERDRAFYRARYASARGAIDPFALFVERAHELLRPGGRWGMVLPDVVLLKNHEPLRHLVLEGTALEHIAHAGCAFPGVHLDTVVITGRRVTAPPPAAHAVTIWHSLPDDWRAHPPPSRRQPQSVFARLPGKRFNLHLDPGDLALLDRLASLPRVGERFEVHEGVHSGNARAKLFLPYRPRGRTAAPLVVGGAEVARYRVVWAGSWIDLSPAAIDRAAGDYANLGRAAWHRRAKIIVRRTGDHLVAAWEPRGAYVSNNLFVVLPRDAATVAEQRALVAVLNSRLLTWCFRAQVPRRGRLFAELKILHLAALPLPAPARWDAAAVRRLDRLAAQRARAADPAAVDRVDAAIDAAVESLYRLSPAERRRVRLAAG